MYWSVYNCLLSHLYHAFMYLLRLLLSNIKVKSHDCHVAKWLVKLHWERLSEKGGCPWRGLVEICCQSKGWMNRLKIIEIYLQHSWILTVLYLKKILTSIQKFCYVARSKHFKFKYDLRQGTSTKPLRDCTLLLLCLSYLVL